MKYKIALLSFLILCTVVGFTAGFHDKEEKKPLPPILLKIDSLCDTQPLQAIQMLDSIAPEMAQDDERARNKYALLTIKARDKAFIFHTSDSLIKEVVKFFDAHGNDNEKIEAYYYLGSVYRDLQDSPKAVESYTKALDIAEAAKERIDTMTISNVCSQLSYLFFTQFNYTQALVYAQKEDSFRNLIGRRNARSLMDVATCLFRLEENDSAFLYYEKAFEWLQTHDDFDSNMDILAEQVFTYAKLGNIQQADKYYDFMESIVNEDNLPENYNTSKAIYFQCKNKPDSAIHYYEKVYQSHQEKGERNGASRELLKLYDMCGNEKKALEYARYYAEVQEIIKADLKIEQTADAYNKYRYRRNMEAEAKASKSAITL